MAAGAIAVADRVRGAAIGAKTVVVGTHKHVVWSLLAAEHAPQEISSFRVSKHATP